jgi:hypothetical protein
MPIPALATRLRFAVCETPLSVALSVAVWLLVIVPAVAVKAVESDPADTVTEGVGTGRSPLLLDIATGIPVGAVLLKVTVQVVEEAEVRLAGLHINDCSTAGATRLTVAVCDAPFSVAVNVAL